MSISKLMVGLVVLLCVAGPQAIAQNTEQTHPGHRGATRAHTPGKGSRDRAAILGALRAMARKMSGLEMVFVVEHLVVNGDWAWVETQPESADGTQHYEPVAGLLTMRKGRWLFLEGPPEWSVCEEEPACADTGRYFKGLANKYPALSPDIFPTPSTKP